MAWTLSGNIEGPAGPEGPPGTSAYVTETNVRRAGGVIGSDVTDVVRINQADYDALVDVDPRVMYVIVEGVIPPADPLPPPEFPPSAQGVELAYAETYSAQSGIITATDITDLSITFEVTDRPVKVILSNPWMSATAAGATIALRIADAAGTQIRVAVETVNSVNALASLSITERITAPGVYTRKGMFYRASGSGTVSSLFGDPAVVASIEAIQV